MGSSHHVSTQEELPALHPVLRSQDEELVNTITHGFGLVLSIAGAFVLVAWALVQGDAWRIAGCLVYAAILVATYAASTLSHSSSRPSQKQMFRILDQAFIYLLIVATYTPFALAYLRTTWWLLFLSLMWTVALFGFFSKLLYAYRVEAVSVWTYVVLGWMPIISGPPLLRLVPAAALWWMLIGGVFYTVGTAFLIYDEKVFHFHAVWHLFVIAGSACHFVAILFFVA